MIIVVNKPGDKFFVSYHPVYVVKELVVGSNLLSEDSADSDNRRDKSDNTNNAYIVVVNESSVVLSSKSDKIIILGSGSIFGNLIDLIAERGRINIISDLLIDSVFNDNVGVQGLFLSLSPCCLHY